ncbi:hypothetical protein KCG48_14410 [Proteiniclasticum sp. BAD-10]|uniref:Uncharacterized protein n=1 Tax=Proteiniclasticum sediminis TaxID=2804028 RepID=A0A941HRK4_9CLOT|nr:hypothetical protein [Proteiniclasticum sediminis]MBR0577496.1 hypothetical protein [Proteiniclasticum sediminis]
MSDLIDFLDRLEKSKIYYRLNKVRDGIMVEVSLPGERWEVEYMKDGTIEIEKFVSDSQIFSENELEVLFANFSD